MSLNPNHNVEKMNSSWTTFYSISCIIIYVCQRRLLGLNYKFKFLFKNEKNKNSIVTQFLSHGSIVRQKKIFCLVARQKKKLVYYLFLSYLQL
jgi:hypothetical protein